MQRIGAVFRREIDEPGRRIECDRIPVVTAARIGRDDHRLEPVVRGRRFDGTSGLRIESLGPRDPADERSARDELAGLTIENVEESVLRRLHGDVRPFGRAHPPVARPGSGERVTFLRARRACRQDAHPDENNDATLPRRDM